MAMFARPSARKRSPWRSWSAAVWRGSVSRTRTFSGLGDAAIERLPTPAVGWLSRQGVTMCRQTGRRIEMNARALGPALALMVIIGALFFSGYTLGKADAAGRPVVKTLDADALQQVLGGVDDFSKPFVAAT